MSDVKCLITDIQRFCKDDGPGIRSTVFMKGCPLHCLWCHNPENYSASQELFYSEDRCISCGRCAASCPNGVHSFSNGIHYIERNKCNMTGKCIEACPTKALEFVAKEMTAEEVFAETVKDKAFYEASGGGVTFSGGEPLMHADFVVEVAKKLKKENIHVACETSLFTNTESLQKVIPYIDLFLVDYKCEPEDYPKFTGGDFKIISENITTLCEKSLPIILRCPIIKDVNLIREHFTSVLEMHRRYPNIIEVDFEPYHPLGLTKSKKLSLIPEYENGFLDKSEIEYFVDKIRDRFRIPVVIK